MSVLIEKDELRAGELAPETLTQAYALARLSGVETEEKKWCEDIIRRQATSFEYKEGVVSIRNRDNYIVALLFYGVEASSEHGRTLRLDELILPNVFIRSFVGCFVPIVDAIAHSLDCVTIFAPTDVYLRLDCLGIPEGFHDDIDGIYRYLSVRD